MPLVKSKGNMYDWVTHMHTHLAGECPHKCSYCYVQRGVARLSGKYLGPLRIVREELQVNYGEGKIIFIEHMNDLFADAVCGFWISDVLGHCRRFPKNEYVFQTKNPDRALVYEGRFPDKHFIGTTIETNRHIETKAPQPEERVAAIQKISYLGCRTFITVEPIMDFDPHILANWLITAQVEFVNIGADSKKNNLPEPSTEKVLELIDRLNQAGVTIRKKVNLERITKEPKNDQTN